MDAQILSPGYPKPAITLRGSSLPTHTGIDKQAGLLLPHPSVLLCLSSQLTKPQGVLQANLRISHQNCGTGKNIPKVRLASTNCFQSLAPVPMVIIHASGRVQQMVKHYWDGKPSHPLAALINVKAQWALNSVMNQDLPKFAIQQCL